MGAPMKAAFVAGLAASLLVACAPPRSQPPRVLRVPVAKDFGALAWRWIGPAQMGGRLDVVAGIAGDPRIIYAGHSSGGLYESTDAGQSFDSIFNAGTSTAIGAFAVAPGDSKVLYVGTGEGFPRNTASPGDGVFVSKNAGKTWSAAGLRGSSHIAKIAVDPNDPNVALVAALGPEWVPGGERGIYRTQDGGKSWQRVLFVNATTGGSDVVFDPANSRIAYAGTFDFLRRPWYFRGGGTGSGVYKSTDNGRSWRRLTDPALHDGLPGGLINRVGVALCYGTPTVVYALVPTRAGMLYRSDDAGTHWRLVNADQDLVFRPFYFSQVRVDPRNSNRVYVISGENQVSTDGGKTFHHFGGGGDNHDLWIDPTDPNRMVAGSDMGLETTVNRGKTWDFLNVVPFGQVYRVGYDRAIPYHVMGGLQDHEVWWGPSTLWNDGEDAGVPGGAWRNLIDWGDGQYAMADPRDPDIVYLDTHFGDLARRDLRTGDVRNISPQPVLPFGTGAGTYRYRFNWSAPLLVSAHDPNVLYFGGNVLFKTADGGGTWSVISPDLSLPCDRHKLGQSGGPISSDNTNAEAYCTIYAIAEDATDDATLWAGTDDGNLWITRDSGVTWSNVAQRVSHLLPDAVISSIHTGAAAGSAYVSFDRHGFGDNSAHVYETGDYGETWTDISHGLPSYVHVVYPDPRNQHVLFAGTEQGVSISFDDGRDWQSLMLSLAPVPVYDLAIQPEFNDLILGTHGRGFYILDDLSPLERLAQTRGPALFAPSVAWRYQPRPTYEPGRGAFVAQNRPYGAIISYYLPQRSRNARPPSVSLEVRDARGALLRTLTATTQPGINRVVWDLTVDPPGGKNAIQDSRPYYVFFPLQLPVPQVPPGTYTVRLRVNRETFEQPVNVRLDPDARASAADLQSQYDALIRLARIQEIGERMLALIANLDMQIAQAERKASPATRRALSAYRSTLDGGAALLRNGNGGQNDGYRHPARLIDQVAYLGYLIAAYSGPPTDVQARLLNAYGAQMNSLQRSLRPLFTAKLSETNALLRSERLAPLRAVLRLRGEGRERRRRDRR